MCDEWMPVIELPLNREQFHQLPRNPAYKYELLGGRVVLTPRPKHYHLVLDLEARTQPSQPLIRRLSEEDWPRLEPVFVGAFRSLQPFGSVDEETRRAAARQCLAKTRTGGDGPFIAAASMVAEQAERLVGAALITLLPPGDL